jgi:hypothetical protein
MLGLLWDKSHPLSSVTVALRSVANNLCKCVLTSESRADSVRMAHIFFLKE